MPVKLMCGYIIGLLLSLLLLTLFPQAQCHNVNVFFWRENWVPRKKNLPLFSFFVIVLFLQRLPLRRRRQDERDGGAGDDEVRQRLQDSAGQAGSSGREREEPSPESPPPMSPLGTLPRRPEPERWAPVRVLSDSSFPQQVRGEKV